MIFRCSKGTLSLTCKCHGNHLEVRERNPEIAGKSGRCMKEAFIIEKLSMFPKIMQQKQHGHSKCSMVMLNTNMNVAKNYYKMCFRGYKHVPYACSCRILSSHYIMFTSSLIISNPRRLKISLSCFGTPQKLFLLSKSLLQSLSSSIVQH